MLISANYPPEMSVTQYPFLRQRKNDNIINHSGEKFLYMTFRKLLLLLTVCLAICLLQQEKTQNPKYKTPAIRRSMEEGFYAGIHNRKTNIGKLTPFNPNTEIVPPSIIQPYTENAIWHGLMLLPDRQAGKEDIGP